MNIEKQFEELLKAADQIADLNESDIISDEELDKVISLLDGVKDPAQDFPSNNGVIYNEDTDESKNIEDTVLVTSNPITGVLTTIPYNSDDVTEESLDDLINLKEEDFKKIEIGYDTFAQNTKAMYPEATDADVTQLLNTVNKYRTGIKFPYFNELPSFIKKEINEFVNAGVIERQASGNTIKQLKNNLAKELFETLIAQNYSSKAFADISKFTMNEINKEKEKLGVGKSVGEYNTKLREEYEVGFLKKAEDLENSDEEGAKETAEKLRLSSRMFTQAYTYEDMYEAYKNKKIKIKNIHIDKFNRTCQEFNRKYYNSTFQIKDVGMTLPILDRIADKKYDITAIKKFIVAFINYTKFYSPSNIHEHVFMYYFIQNILSLDIKLPGNEYEGFNDLLKENIHKFLDLIIQMDAEK